MADLKDIPGIGKAALELLDAAGIRDAAHLARQQPENLLAEVTSANDVLEIVKRLPARSTVEKWVAAAAKIERTTPQPTPPGKPQTSPAEPSAPIAPPVNYENSPQVTGMLEQAPYAIPLPGKILMEKKVRVSDIAAGLLLNRYSGDLDVRIGDPEAPTHDLPEPRPSQNTATLTPHTPGKKGTRLPARPRENHEQDRVALIRTPLEKTNRGKNPESRRYIRGVLHTHPIGLRIGALSAILLLITLPLAVISTFLLLASREMPASLPWVPQWILAFPIALPIAGLFYLIWGFNGKCRICNQKLFVHKGALKHIKAHRLPGLGYVLPLSIHLLTFSWFRCSSCGTPVRLKK